MNIVGIWRPDIKINYVHPPLKGWMLIKYKEILKGFDKFQNNIIDKQRQEQFKIY